MDPNLMIFIILVLLIIGGFTTLAPIARRLPDALDAWMEHRRAMGTEPDGLQHLESAIRDLRSRMDSMEDQVEMIAERQDFTERLLEGDTPGASSQG